MRSHPTIEVVLLALASVSLAGVAGSGCAPGAETSESSEILVTEDVGGAIDAELSTAQDPRGRRQAESGRVLPPGFPAELPLPAEVSVDEQGPSEGGKHFVVLATSVSAVSLASSWVSLLEAEGWSVHRSDDSTFGATKAGLAITATLTPAGTGSRLRITY